MRTAKPIRPLPGNTIAFKAFLKCLLADKIPEERAAFLKLVREHALEGIADATVIRSMSDIDSRVRQEMIAVLDGFLMDLSD